MDAEEAGDLYDRAVNSFSRDKQCSTSYIQRRLSVGYNKRRIPRRADGAGRRRGAPNHAGKREILVEAAEDDSYQINRSIFKRVFPSREFAISYR